MLHARTWETDGCGAGAEVLEAQIATHFVRSERLDALEQRLQGLGEAARDAAAVKDALDAFQARAQYITRQRDTEKRRCLHVRSTYGDQQLTSHFRLSKMHSRCAAYKAWSWLSGRQAVSFPAWSLHRARSRLRWKVHCSRGCRRWPRALSTHMYRMCWARHWSELAEKLVTS